MLSCNYILLNRDFRLYLLPDSPEHSSRYEQVPGTLLPDSVISFPLSRERLDCSVEIHRCYLTVEHSVDFLLSVTKDFAEKAVKSMISKRVSWPKPRDISILPHRSVRKARWLSIECISDGAANNLMNEILQLYILVF